MFNSIKILLSRLLQPTGGENDLFLHLFFIDFRELTVEFERFATHYGFHHSEFCRPNSGNEKGDVVFMVVLGNQPMSVLADLSASLDMASTPAFHA